MTTNPTDLTPVQLRGGIWYKRDDLFRLPNGVNGSKLRMAFNLISWASENGILRIVSAAPVNSPQSPIAATVAKLFGLESVTIVGGASTDTALRHSSIRMAAEQGSEVRTIKVGYVPALQAAARSYVADNGGAWNFTYSAAGASVETQLGVTKETAAQVANLPDGIETIVLPFGSGNTAAGVLYGLATVRKPASLKRVVLMTIGPDKRSWLEERLASLGAPLGSLGVEIEQIHLHPAFATYGDKMPETLDGIVLHPTYEGKVARYLELTGPEWWYARNEKTLLWIVGGPL